jgi:hypothetical protein
MQLPNKLYSYENSTLALIPKVLVELQYGSKKVKDYIVSIKPSLDDPTDFPDRDGLPLCASSS